MDGRTAVAGDPTTAQLVPEFKQLMEQRKLDTIAAQLPDTPGRFAAAMYFPGTQILAVSGIYEPAEVLLEQIGKGAYREVYTSLNSTALREGKLFVQDLGANGLHKERDGDAPFDIVYESVTNRIMFDGDWDSQRLTRDEYQARFVEFDRRYATMLSALMTELQRTASRPMSGQQEQ
jgi:hypothetical protein